MAFVNHNEPIATQVGQRIDDLADGEYPSAQAICLSIIFPHVDEVFRADNQRFEVMIVFLYACKCRSHEGFTESDDIAYEYTAPSVEVMRCDFHGGGLEFKQLVLKFTWDPKFSQPSTCFLREVVRHFDVDVIGRN